jgi:hypothetical protein
MIKLIRLRILTDFAEAAIKLVPTARSIVNLNITNRVESRAVTKTMLPHRTSHK